VLLEPNTPYDTVVQVMDRVRVLEVNTGLSVMPYELFPDVSIGDAPARGSAGAATPAAGNAAVSLPARAPAGSRH
jgi:hypothetical protein